MSARSVVIISTAMVAGVVVGANLLNLGGDPVLDLYGPPKSYIVEREDPNVIYTTVGEALLDCEPIAPVDAVLESGEGKELDRVPLFRADGRAVLGKNAKLRRGPRKVQARDYRFKANTRILDKSDQFRLRVTCRNDDYKRFIGYYGPLPMPANGQTLVKVEDEHP